MCREQLRKRWQDEYLKALQERHTLQDIGNIVLVADDNNPRSKWNLRRIIDVIKGKDDIIRGYKIRNNKGYTIKRPLQLIQNLEIKTASSKIDRVSTKTDEQVKADE